MKLSIRNRIAGSLLKLDSDSLFEAARRRTGLDDFGNPPVEPALSILLNSLESQADLHPLGRLLIRIHLRDILETRLRLVERWKELAARMAATQVKRPIFIVGMPRSGSTYLHELLAENPGYRAPRVWEVMFPISSRNGDPTSDEQHRVRKAEFCLWWFRKLAPRADSVYPMRARTPHECVAIHSYTLLSEEFISTCRIPAYEAYLHSTDLTPAYLWQKQFLQYLQLDSPGQRWVLKSPDHVYGLEQLLAVFPDAFIIQTHRNPVEVLKSSADLTRVLRKLYGRSGDPEEIRLREARILAEGAERFIEFRDAHPELGGRIIDVTYNELTTEPMATVHRICEGVRTPMTNGMAQRVRHMASTRARYCGPRASAQPASQKFDRATGLRFERYCSRFGVRFGETDASKWNVEEAL